MLICEFVDPESVSPARVAAFRDVMEGLHDRDLVTDFRWAGPILHRFPHVRVDLSDVADGAALTSMIREAITQSGLTPLDVTTLPNHFYVQRWDPQGVTVMASCDDQATALNEATRLSAADPDRGYRVSDDLHEGILFYVAGGQVLQGDARSPLAAPSSASNIA